MTLDIMSRARRRGPEPLRSEADMAAYSAFRKLYDAAESGNSQGLYHTHGLD